VTKRLVGVLLFVFIISIVSGCPPNFEGEKAYNKYRPVSTIVSDGWIKFTPEPIINADGLYLVGVATLGGLVVGCTADSTFKLNDHVSIVRVSILTPYNTYNKSNWVIKYKEPQPEQTSK